MSTITIILTIISIAALYFIIGYVIGKHITSIKIKQERIDAVREAMEEMADALEEEENEPTEEYPLGGNTVEPYDIHREAEMTN